jgi:DNA-binding transcriptional regulator YiaG
VKAGNSQSSAKKSRKTKQTGHDDLIVEPLFELSQNQQASSLLNPGSTPSNHRQEPNASSILLQTAQQPLNAQQIEAAVQYLRTQSPLLDLVTVQLTQQLVAIYRQQVSDQMSWAGQTSIEPGLPYFEVVTSGEDSPTTLKTNLDSESLLSRIKSLVENLFEKHRIWEDAAKEIWSNLIVWAIEDLKREAGGETALENWNQDTLHQNLSDYLFGQNTIAVKRKIHRLEEFYSQTLVNQILHDLDLPNYPSIALEQLLGLNSREVEKTSPNTEVRLSQVDTIAAIPTGLPIVSSISAQLQTELWKPDAGGVAHFRYYSKNNQSNFLEHYITSPGDIETLPWEAAEQIINKFGFNTVKLQFIFAAHAMRQGKPWESTFTLKASDIVTELGWDKNHSSTLPAKRNEVASIAYALSCLLVKAVWIEGRGKTKVDASTPVGRMWEVLVDVHGQFDWTTGKIDQPDEVYITVRPGLWTAHFLNQAGSRAKEALYQFGYLALNILRLDPYHDELTLRLAIHLTLDVRIRARDRNPYEYKVKTLLEAVLPEIVVQEARRSSEKARSLFDRWNHALKLLLELGWYPENYSPELDASLDKTPMFYTKPYPEWLDPCHKLRKPKGWIELWLEQKLVIKPPNPIPQRMEAFAQPKQARQRKLEANALTRKLTGSDVKIVRKARKWTQAKLAGTLKVHQSLIAKIESGDRPISPELEISLRRVLDL